MFSQMKDTKHISLDFHSVTLVMPQGHTLGRWGCSGRHFFQTWSCGISNRLGWRAEQHASKIFILGLNVWPWGEVKRSNIIKFCLPCQFHFYYTKLCVFSQIKDKNILNRIFILLPGIMGQGWDLRVLGVKNFSVGICDGVPSTACSI